jgi:ribosomal protein S18 acetylase RimI-like enzyme
MTVELRDQPTGSGEVCRAVLAELPTWFGIQDAVDDYIALADRTPTVVASAEGRDVGLLIVIHHSPYAAEVYLMGVLPERHRQGIGRQMLEHAEAALAAAGVEFLQVKTLSASRDDEGYAKTRAFYLAYGFRPLEEFPDLWNPQNPALQMVKVVATAPRTSPR